MAAPTDLPLLTVEAIQSFLRSTKIGRTIRLLSVASSTNQEAMALAQEGAEDGTVVAAEQQTAGKGRLGRRWHSPAGDNLYCSVILRTLPDVEKLSLIPLLSAVAVAKAVHSAAGVPAKLKWPNDIVLGRRKLGGLLCESAGIGQAHPIVVIGIGLNVNGAPDSFPEDLREIATSLAIETGRPFDRAAVLAAVLGELEKALAPLPIQPPDRLLRDYVELCSTLGQRVRVSLSGSETVSGLADSIGADGSLRILADKDGSKVEVRAGDVIHLR